MIVSAADRLYSALLTEMASGNYAAGKRFLSHRRIMRQWRVSATTANRALEMLVKCGTLEAVDRSGHYLCAKFISNALLALNQLNAERNVEPSPSKTAGWRTSVITAHGDRKPLTHIAVIVILPESLLSPDLRDEAMLSKCIATLLTVRGIFQGAEQASVSVNPTSYLPPRDISQGGEQAKTRALGKQTAHASMRGERGQQEQDNIERPQVNVRIHINNGEPETEQRCMKEVLASQPQGVIIVRRISPYLVASMANTLLKHLIPVVTLYDDCENTDMLSVNFNNIGCGYNAAEELISKGHRNLAVLIMEHEHANKVHHRNSNDRLYGFEQAARKHGDCKVARIAMKATAAGRKHSLNQLLKAGATAVFSVGEEPLCHLISAMDEQQLRIPEDLSVIICSSTPNVKNYSKPVDIVYLDFETLGKRAFQALYDFYHGHTPQKHILTNPVIQSVGSIRKLRRSKSATAASREKKAQATEAISAKALVSPKA